MNDGLYKAIHIHSREWVEGYYVKKCGFSFIYETTECPQNNYEVNDETVCPYTGLNDNNGNKVWLNDVLQLDNIIAVVKFGKYDNNGWDNTQYGFYLEFKEDGDNKYFRQDILYWLQRNMIVVGNIFENKRI